MAPQSLPEDVERFLKEHVRSVAELEVLLLLHRRPDQWWTAQSVNHELRTSLQSAAECLGQLHGGGLVEGNEADPRAYRVARAHAGEGTVVGRLAQLFRERMSSVIEAIYAPKRDSLRDFADAFRLTKKKDDKNG